jgi:hypothetical protein
VKAFQRGGQEDKNIYICPFCKGTGVRACSGPCRGQGKQWPNELNVARLWKTEHVHRNTFMRFLQAQAAKSSERDVGKEEAKRKIATGQGAFKMSGNANLLPMAQGEDAQG